MFNTLIAYGHNIDDVKNKYTVAQVYRFYEMCRKKDYDNYKMAAIIMYNAISCGSLPDSSKTRKEQNKVWRKFIDNLDWDVMMKKATAKPDPVRAFRGMSVIFNRGVK